MFARSGKCNLSPCKFLHEPPAASTASPSPPAHRNDSGRSVAAAGGSQVLALRAILPAGGNKAGDEGRDAGSDSG